MTYCVGALKCVREFLKMLGIWFPVGVTNVLSCLRGRHEGRQSTATFYYFLFIILYDLLHVRRSNFKPHLVWFILRPKSQLVCSLNELEIVAPWHVLSTSICRNYRHCLSNIIAIQTLILFWYNCYVTRQWKCTLTVHADIFVNMHVLCPRMMEVACIHVAKH